MDVDPGPTPLNQGCMYDAKPGPVGRRHNATHVLKHHYRHHYQVHQKIQWDDSCSRLEEGDVTLPYVGECGPHADSSETLLG